MPLVAEYLRLRADGINRVTLMRQLKISWPITSLNGMEWNAQWVIQRDTHPALISETFAEALLVQLEILGTGHTRDRAAAFLLSGLLVRRPAIAGMETARPKPSSTA